MGFLRRTQNYTLDQVNALYPALSAQGHTVGDTDVLPATVSDEWHEVQPWHGRGACGRPRWHPASLTSTLAPTPFPTALTCNYCIK